MDNPTSFPVIGLSQLPPEILKSKILESGHLNQLASVPHLPAIDPLYEDEHLKHIMLYYSTSPDEMETEIHVYAASLLDKGELYGAWQVLLLSSSII